MTWFLPSRGRPERLQQALDHLIAAGTSTPGLIVLDGESRDRYADLRLPENWTVAFLPNDMGGVARVWNWCIDNHPDLPWYGMITDDLHVRTPGWDVKLIEAAGSKGIASANDGWQANANVTQGRLHGAAVFGGDLIRTVGYWAPRGMIHNYVDDLWEMIGRQFKCWTTCMDVVTEHMHPGNGKAGLDETYARNMTLVDGRLDFATKTFAADQVTWKRWVDCEQAMTWDALTHLFARAPLANINLSGKRVAVLTPAHQNNVCTQYLQSWSDTLMNMAQYGVGFNLVTLPGESMIMRARNNLVWAFLNTTDCEFAMLIDADMGWNGPDVLRLMALCHAGKRVVGGAGPRKREPITFCTRLVGPMVQFDPATGCVRANEIGTGFLMIHRSVFEDIAKAGLVSTYDDDGRTVHAFFEHTIVGGKLFSEDYTFAHRAAKVGHEIWVDPSIELQHIGDKVFRGRLGDELAKAQVVTDEAAPVEALPQHMAAD